MHYLLINFFLSGGKFYKVFHRGTRPLQREVVDPRIYFTDNISENKCITTRVSLTRKKAIRKKKHGSRLK